MFDAAVLKETANRQFPGRVTVLHQTFEHYNIGMGLANRSDLTEKINRSLLGVIASYE